MEMLEQVRNYELGLAQLFSSAKCSMFPRATTSEKVADTAAIFLLLNTRAAYEKREPQSYDARNSIQ